MQQVLRTDQLSRIGAVTFPKGVQKLLSEANCFCEDDSCFRAPNDLALNKAIRREWKQLSTQLFYRRRVMISQVHPKLSISGDT